MRILVTGATGFVGSWMREELAGHVPEAVVFGSAHGVSVDGTAPDGVTLHACDLTDPEAVTALVRAARPTHVVHLAGFASAAGGEAAAVLRANVEAARYLLESLRAQGEPCRALLASSGYVYGATAGARETDPLAPFGVYAESKAQMEIMARDFAADNLSVVITRAFNHTGPRQGAGFVVPAFARQIARIERGLDPPVVRVGNLEARRDFLDVRDVVRAYRLLLRADSETHYSVVNVCSGQAVAVREVLNELVTQSQVPVAVETDPERMRPSDMPICVGNSARLRAWTGWAPQRTLAETLGETLSWWRGRADLEV